MERPILFNDAMVRAILSGAKTQTRRPVLVGGAPVHHYRTEGAWRCLPPHNDAWAYMVERDVRGGVVRCPFGAPGDTLWVRECYALGRVFDESRAAELPIIERDVPVWYRADGSDDESWANRGRWRPSIHMPRWASRMTLRVTDVRVERVQDITEADARAEGVYPLAGGYCAGGADAEWNATARKAFEGLWSDTYGAESWAANPWVWVVSFEREAQNG